MTEIEQKLVDWVKERNEDNPDVEFTLDTDLFSSGLLDSLGFVVLATLVEDLRGEPINFEAVKPEELVSIRQIVDKCLAPAPR